MADTNKKTDGPACACGKTDLFDEWLKQNEEKVNTSVPTSQADDQISSADAAGKRDSKSVHAKK